MTSYRVTYYTFRWGHIKQHSKIVDDKQLAQLRNDHNVVVSEVVELKEAV